MSFPRRHSIANCATVRYSRRWNIWAIGSRLISRMFLCWRSDLTAMNHHKIHIYISYTSHINSYQFLFTSHINSFTSHINSYQFVSIPIQVTSIHIIHILHANEFAWLNQKNWRGPQPGAPAWSHSWRRCRSRFAKTGRMWNAFEMAQFTTPMIYGYIW